MSIAGINPNVAAADIARRHGVTVGELLGPGRAAHLVRARDELCRALRDVGWSYPAIGRFVGGRDHTTVRTACERCPSEDA